MLFRTTSLPPLDPGHEIAGSFCVGGDAIVTGTYLKVAIYSASQRTLISADPSPFAAQCSGVQWADDHIVCLGFDRKLSHTKPADWAARVLAFDHGGASRATVLPPGNWRLVRGRHGPRAIVYDCSEDQGVLAVDTSTQRIVWSARLGTCRKLRPTAHGSVAILVGHRAHHLTELALDTGTVIAEHVLPRTETYAWTNMLELDHGAWLLGGVRHSDDRPTFAHLQRGKLEILRVSPLEAHFSADQITRARGDEQLGSGFDLGNVAELQAHTLDRAVVALGGNGDDLGDSNSGCAMGYLTLSNGALETEVIDEEDGCAGVLPLAAGGWVVDCGGTLRIVEPARSPAVAT